MWWSAGQIFAADRGRARDARIRQRWRRNRTAKTIDQEVAAMLGEAEATGAAEDAIHGELRVTSCGRSCVVGMTGWRASWRPRSGWPAKVFRGGTRSRASVPTHNSVAQSAQGQKAQKSLRLARGR
jgi:hypothetical protein